VRMMQILDWNWTVEPDDPSAPRRPSTSEHARQYPDRPLSVVAAAVERQ
jgi:hypothetical protein